MSAALEVRCPDIECEGCANAIKRSVGAVPGVEYVDVGVHDKKVTIRYDEGQVSPDQIRARLQQAGFPPQ